MFLQQPAVFGTVFVPLQHLNQPFSGKHCQFRSLNNNSSNNFDKTERSV